MKIVIVGGVAGGATAATRMRRLSEENDVIIFEKGEYVSFANCGLPYHIGGVIEERSKLLLQTPESLRSRYHLDVRIFSEVLSIDRDTKHVHVRNLQTGEDYFESYDKLLLSPGAEPVKPPFEGIDSDRIFTLRNVADMDRIINATHHSSDFVVVGGGFIGLEIAENLMDLHKNVHLVELGDQVMAPVDFEIASFVHNKASEKGIELLLKTAVEKFETSGDHLNVFLNNGTILQTDAVILAIGVRPETALARNAGLEIGETKGILVNKFLQTSDPDIYAVGDAVEVEHYISGKKVLIPLAWPANRQGRLVADNMVRGNHREYDGSMGSSILKFFELSVAATGLNEKTLKRNQIPYRSVIITKSNHAGYYPGAKDIVLKILFDNAGKIFGAQAVGQEGVDKRIDIIAAAIKGKMTVTELQEIEVTYAPPYNSAKDPVNIAGYAAENILNGDLSVISYSDLRDYEKEHNAIILDVRSAKEFERGFIEGAVNINVDHLREQLPQLDRNRTYIIYCQVGLRGYLAYRILRNNGFGHVVNLNGGYNLWKNVYPHLTLAQ
ncbi:FAD-dependent oxidoreductase [Weeksellaceae bacterium A-14]|uniref:FAD-dependent oxidoreductase n=1 Tax=Daejeonia sp. YH14 TaxID=3439042 RepID=UPI0031E4CF3B